MVEEVIVKTVPLPTQVEAFMDKEKGAISICNYDELKHYLLNKKQLNELLLSNFMLVVGLSIYY